ncbi:unnamed protein product [Lepidochelys olivacea]
MLGLLPALPCLLLLSLPGPNDDGTMVLTTSSPIRGKCLPAGSGTVTAFLGIPYAEPRHGGLALPDTVSPSALEPHPGGHRLQQHLLPASAYWLP